MSIQVLVVRPKTLSASDKALLRKSGVVCVEANDPSSVRMLTPEGPALGSNDLLYAAMKAIAADKFSSNTAESFAKTLATLVKATQP